MADHSRSHSRSHSHDLFHLVGFASIRKAYKSFISKCYPDHKNHPSLSKKPTQNKTNPRSSQLQSRSPGEKYSDENNGCGINNSERQKNSGSIESHTIKCKVSHSSPRMSRTMSGSPLTRSVTHGPSRLVRSTSRISQTAVPPTKSSLLGRRNSLDSSPANLRCTFSKNLSRKGSTIIMYSNSDGLMKPPPMEMQLDCTLEELCFGCVKMVEITRDTVKDGQVIEEDEVLAIKVKPGWKKGTKITFEGKGNEMPGAEPGDVIFVVAEKQHHLFTREGDDLDLGVEIPLVDALTGCTLSVPLLGGQEMSLMVDDIIRPGYEKIVTGQGMPKQNEAGTRGNLRITFLVEFPQELSKEERSHIVNILENTTYE